MIITLIGSARFEGWFKLWNKALSLAGHQVFGLSSYPSENGNLKEWYTPEDKLMLDWVHKEKIRSSQAVLLLNVMSYTGESTEGEVTHALDLGLPIYPLESWGLGIGVSGMHKAEYRDAAIELGVLNAGGSKRNYHQRPFRNSFEVYDLLNGVGPHAPPDFALRQRLVTFIKDTEAQLIASLAKAVDTRRAMPQRK